jgi:uncharacterized protein (DUF1778 family)
MRRTIRWRIAAPFVLDDQRWGEFMVALDAPPADNPRLRALLARKPAWEA